EHGSHRWTACRGIARQGAQKELIDGAEEPLNPSPSARHACLREDEGHAQIRADLLQVLRGKVAAVIRVETVGNAADLPLRMRLPPQGLAQDKGGLYRRRGRQIHPESSHGAAIVIQDDGKPRPYGLAFVIEEPEV